MNTELRAFKVKSSKWASGVSLPFLPYVRLEKSGRMELSFSKGKTGGWNGILRSVLHSNLIYVLCPKLHFQTGVNSLTGDQTQRVFFASRQIGFSFRHRRSFSFRNSDTARVVASTNRVLISDTGVNSVTGMQTRCACCLDG